MENIHDHARRIALKTARSEYRKARLEAITALISLAILLANPQPASSGPATCTTAEHQVSTATPTPTQGIAIIWGKDTCRENFTFTVNND